MRKLPKNSAPYIFFILGFILIGSSILSSYGTFNLVQVNIEKLELVSGKIKLSALLFTPSHTQEPRPRPAILAYHGWGGSKENLIPICLGFAEAGFVVLAPDLRGHGESQGIADLGLLDQQDGRVAIDYLESRTILVNSSALATWGSSFGGVISLLVAETDNRIRATVASSTPANISAWLLKRDFRWQERVNFRPHVLIDPENATEIAIRNPMSYLDNISSLLVLHGESDAIVPVQHAMDLYARTPTNNKSLVIFSGQGHNLAADAVKLETTLFLKSVFKNGGTRVLGSSLPYYLIVFAWVLLLSGGLSITMGILSFFPYIDDYIASRIKLSIVKPQFNGTIRLLLVLLGTYVIGRGGSVLVSLMIPTYYSTIIAIFMGTTLTGGIIIAGLIATHTPSLIADRFWNSNYVQKLVIHGILIFAVIFTLYTTFLLFLDHPWVPFVNSSTALALWSVLVTIGLVLSFDAIFFWEILYTSIRRYRPSWSRRQMYTFQVLTYLFTKIVVFFGLMFILYLWMLEITLIFYGLIVFGVLAFISPLVRLHWGLSAVIVFNVISGLVAYSTFSLFFLVI
ncbi:MAG: alpha/beta hydrolase [Candidatus Thorarchaeota archaeon]